MSEPNICRLCGEENLDRFVEIYDKNGFPTEVYKITANFFSSRFLDLENGNGLKIMCYGCWENIFEFYNYQGFVAEKETVETMGHNICRFCKEHSDNNVELYDINDFPTNACIIAVNFFSSRFIDLKNGKDHKIVCRECWNSILTFYRFQGFVLEKASSLKRRLKYMNDKENGIIMKYEISDDSEEDEYGDIIDNVPITPIEDNVSDKEEDYDIPCSLLEELDNHLKSGSECGQLNESMEENVTTNNKSPKKDNDEKNNHIHKSKRKRLKTKQSAAEDNRKTTPRQQNQIFLNFIESKQKTAKDADDLIAQWLPKLQCVECEEKHSSFTLLKEHFQKSHKNKRFYVKCCQREFLYRCQIAEHVCLHFDPYVFNCKNCNRVFTSRANLVAHKSDRCVPLEPSRDRKTFKEMDDNIAKWMSKLKCVVCKEMLDTFTILKQHFNSKHPNETFYVVCCRNKFTTRHRMDEHIKKHLKSKDV
ncbi:uncharacterized protein [Musca autumnalis]|uniref:uncharacterized protein n=1 Tax=Musca autumnalis TaxID=221902 RepID=UPI003CE6BA95